MVMDLAELKRVVADAVIQRFDHADLNADPLFSQGDIPTTRISWPWPGTFSSPSSGRSVCGG